MGIFGLSSVGNYLYFDGGFMTGFEEGGNDSAVAVQTPEGIAFLLHPAGILVRGCAWAIDTCIQGVLIAVLQIIMWGSGQELGYWFLLLLAFVVNWFYHCAFEIFGRGQSLGKRIMGIRVVCSNGSPINPGASFLRNLLRFADAFMGLYLIAFVCMAISPGFRRLGDWVADTLVVYVAESRSRKGLASHMKRSETPLFANIAKRAPVRKLGYEEKQAILAFASRYPLLGKARADEVARLWAGDLCGRESQQGEDSASTCILGVARTLGG